jgi:hypothetical protein
VHKNDRVDVSEIIKKHKAQLARLEKFKRELSKEKTVISSSDESDSSESSDDNKKKRLNKNKLKAKKKAKKSKSHKKHSESSRSSDEDESDSSSSDSSSDGEIVKFPAAHDVKELKKSSKIKRGYKEKLTDVIANSKMTDLPRFGGDPAEWGYFAYQVKYQVENGRYTNCQVMEKIKKALYGEPLTIVNNQCISYSTDYRDAMKVLQKRFGTKQVIVESFIKQIKNKKHCGNKLGSEFANLAAAVRKYVSVLKTNKWKAQLEDATLEHEITDKFKGIDFVYMDWCLEKKGRSADLKRLDKFMHRMWKYNGNIKLSIDEKVDEKKNFKKPVSKPVMTHSTDVRVTKEQFCNYCEVPGHYMGFCRIFKRLNVKERNDAVENKNLCRICFNKGHRADKCRNLNAKCNKSNCQEAHHLLLHPHEAQQQANNDGQNNRQHFQRANDNQNNDRVQRNNQQGNQVNQRQFNNNNNNNNYHNNNQAVQNQAVQNNNDNRMNVHAPQVGQVNLHTTCDVLMKIVKVRIYGVNKYRDIYALLDDGSSVTLIDKDITESLGISGDPEELQLVWTSGVKRSENALVCDLTVSSVKNVKKYVLGNVYAIDNLELGYQYRRMKNLQERFVHLRGLGLEDFGAKPQMLIGLDQVSFVTGHQISGKLNEPIAVQTKFGWTVCGPLAGIGGQRYVGIHSVADGNVKSTVVL